MNRTIQTPRQDEGVGQHQGDDGADARVLLVPLRDDHDEGQVDHQRRERVEGRVAHPVGRQDRLRRDTQLGEQGHEDGREDRPLGDQPGHDQVQGHDDQDHPDEQRQAADARGLEPLRQAHRQHVGQLAVVEDGDELADHQQHEHETRESREGLGHGRDDVVGTGERARPEAVADAGQQEHEGDDEQQAVHERRLPDEVARDRVAQRGARRQRHQQHADERRDHGHERELEATRLVRRVDLRLGVASPDRSAVPVQGPRRGSMMRSVMMAAVMASTMDETMAK